MKVIYNMATMPQRINALRDVIPSILKQCDELHIYLNNFNHVPNFLKNEKIFTYLSSEHLGDLGDVGKFYNCDSWVDGYIFTVDDKIIYPDDYTKKTIEAIDKYNGKAVISWHGRIINLNKKCTSYYKDYKQFIRLCDGLSVDIKLDIAGTGVMAFKASNIPYFDLKTFEYINMTDIWMSLFLHNNNVDIIRPKGRDRWIKLSKNWDSNYSISSSISDQLHTKIINEKFIKHE